MTESEYIIVSNKESVKNAITILRGVLSGEEYGVSTSAYKQVMGILYEAQTKLFDMSKIDQEPK